MTIEDRCADGKSGRGNECAKNKHIKPDRWRCQKDVHEYFSDFHAKLKV